MAKLDTTKPVQTVDGKKARIICTDGASEISHPIIALIMLENGLERLETYTVDGYVLNEKCNSPNDLINVPEKVYILLAKNNRSGKFMSVTFDKRELAYKFWKENLSEYIFVKIIETEVTPCEQVTTGNP